MKYTFYIVYNVLYQLFSFWLLLLVGTYYNEFLIAKCLFWLNSKESADLARYESIKAFTLFNRAAIVCKEIEAKINDTSLENFEILGFEANEHETTDWD